ncbi:MAG: hypothetical protein Q9169_004364 [Polycauliona sp. 2 TL-2023]
MVASTLLYCFSIAPFMLAIARALQGCSAVVIWVVGLALLVDTMGAAGSGYAIGWTTVASCTGSTIGPFIGGIVFDLAGHYAVFGVAFAVLGVDIALRSAMIERRQAEAWNMKTQALTYGTTDDGTSSKQAVGQESKGKLDGACPEPGPGETMAASSPSVNIDCPPSRLPVALQLLGNVCILAALWGSFALSCMICALEEVLPLYTRRIFNWSPTLSGACMAAFIVPMFLDPLVGKLAASPGMRRVLAVVGFAFASLAFFALTAITGPPTLARKSLLWAMLGSLGLGYSLAATPLMLTVSKIIEANERCCPGIYGPGKGVASSFALYNVATASGSLLGPAVAGWAVQRMGWAGLCAIFGGAFAVTQY